MPGIYIHIPFCLQKCNYCNFYSEIGPREKYTNYLEALKIEINKYQTDEFWANAVFNTIYLGGGTPSILSIQQIEKLLSGLNNGFHFVDSPEITLEVNPETVDYEKLIHLKEAGINRLNIGIQSFHEAELKLLNRIHSAQQGLKIIKDAQKAGFENLGIDLIFGIPGQTLKMWQTNLKHAISLEIQHLSTYGLTYEPGTPLSRLAEEGKIALCPETLERDMYWETIDYLSAAGFEHYEISNFARPGFRSQHNQIYWRDEPYLGLGASAHSFQPSQRWWNVNSLAIYQKKLLQGEPPVQSRETLTEEQQILEFIMLGLRRKEGIDLSGFEQKFAINFLSHFENVLEKLNFYQNNSNANKWLVLENGYLRLTRAGFMIYDEICGQFV